MEPGTQGFQRFAKNTAARRGSGLGELVGQQREVVRCERSALGRGETTVLCTRGAKERRGLACSGIGCTAPTAEGYFGPRGNGGRRGAVWPRKHGVCVTWAHNGGAARGGALGRMAKWGNSVISLRIWEGRGR